MSAGARSVAAGGAITGSALGDNSRVTYVERQYVAEAGVPVGWPVVVGTIPVLASAFQLREVLRQAVDEARGHGRSVVLASDTPRGERSRSGTRVQVMSGGGGVGKSQLAAAYAREAVEDGADLVVWTSATDIQQVLTVYAQAAALVQAPGRTGTAPEADARAFLSWLAATDRRWLVVLDDITNPDAIEPWWPDSQRGTGWTLATTRLKDPRLTGGGRARIDVDAYAPAEATDYLTARLTHDHKAHLIDRQAPALAEALGHLPLALGHAAAYMLRENVSCSAYLERFTEGHRRCSARSRGRQRLCPGLPGHRSHPTCSAARTGTARPRCDYATTPGPISVSTASRRHSRTRGTDRCPPPRSAGPCPQALWVGGRRTR
ncbi:NB-ARC domain-containing protein [Streptomyces sp. NPDC005989]|uniref:NB-ARC domain-containing protein n=1 Tax=Streptomyces sp. NPDC005989 TaxID=3156727 RepID=UPI0033FAA7CE